MMRADASRGARRADFSSVCQLRAQRNPDSPQLAPFAVSQMKNLGKGADGGLRCRGIERTLVQASTQSKFARGAARQFWRWARVEAGRLENGPHHLAKGTAT